MGDAGNNTGASLNDRLRRWMVYGRPACCGRYKLLG